MSQENKFEDISPRDKRSKKIKNNSSSAGSTKIRKHRPRLSKRARVGVWIFVLVSLGSLCFAVLTLFSGAVINIQPKTAIVEFDSEEFSASYEGSNSGDIKYEVMEVSEEQEKIVNASGIEKIEEKASGKIVIYNDYKRSTQKLIDNTRFKAPNGLIYKIKEAVRVPGQHVAGGELVPGELEVKVYANKVGSKYNLEKGAEFTVPGLKGTELYDGFYAKAVTDISGGVSEMRPVLSSEDKQKALENWKSELKESIREKAFSQVPEGFHLYEDMYKISTEIVSMKQEGEGEAKIKMKTTFTGIILHESDLARMVASSKVEGYDDSSVYLKEVEDYKLSLKDPQYFDPMNKKPFNFVLDGESLLVWKINAEELKTDLAGENKTNLDDILSEYKGVSKAQANIRPFWRMKFPGDKRDIKVKLHKVEN